ncbi:MAG: TetR/AcrR family transcriptional regulator [Endozoicomonas sp.]|uniref:TetR/AcrR family transcriptional regulator n=1 Tax=Endozoicomonas sp. TaxID=1892382 RepID=UPI003D9B41AA
MEATYSEERNRVLSQMAQNEGAALGNGTLKYQGRKTSRANSEQRRRTILEAALRIVVRDGVRGVRHRAVAKEAQVPLSATTYYFKDISDLITDTFTLFVEMGAETFKAFWEDSDDQLQKALSLLDGSNDSRDQFVDQILELAVNYVTNQLTEHRDYLIAERAFQLECLRNENLRPIAFNHQSYLLNSLVTLFKRIGSSQPETDAQLFASVIIQVEYEGLVQEGGLDIAPIRDRLRRQIVLMFKR